MNTAEISFSSFDMVSMMGAGKHSKLQDKNLLILSSHYPDKEGLSIGGQFVKEQVKYLKDYFDKILVVVPTPRNPRLLWRLAKVVPKSLFPVYAKVVPDDVFRDYKYCNIRVKYLKYWHIPADFFRKKVGEKMFSMVDAYLKKTGGKFDIAHAHFSYPAGYAAAQLTEKTGIPSVLTIHEDCEWFEKERESKDPNLEHAWKKVDMIIRVNRRDMHTLEKYNKKRNIVYISNGFDSNKFHPMDRAACRKKLMLPKDKKIFVNVAAIVEQKNHHNMISAVELAVKKRKDILVIIIGAGPLRKELEECIETRGLSEHMKFVGLKPHAEVPVWISASDAFLLSSNGEGNPTVMFEALGCGRPYVGTDTGGVLDVITNHKYGYTCPVRNPKALAGIILQACETEWSEKDIAKYAKEHTWQAVADRIAGAYEGLLSRKRG